MTGTDDREKSDIFRLLLALLAALTVFYLLRPPVLLLLDYAVGPPKPAPDDVIRLPGPLPNPIPAVPLPESLSGSQTPSRWSDPLTVEPEMLAVAQSIAKLTNDERAKHQLLTLREDPQLAEIASRHSRDMILNNYMAHVSNQGDGPAQRVGMLHRRLFGTVSENIASYESGPLPADQLGSQFMTQWINSLGHRRNLLAQDSTYLGVGCYAGASTQSQLVQRKCTQIFARAFAYSESPLPAELAVGAELTVRLVPEPGNALPSAIVQADLLTDRVVSGSGNGKLTERGGAAEGKLQVQGTPGLYGLMIHVPSKDVPGQYLVIPGPYIRVR